MSSQLTDRENILVLREMLGALGRKLNEAVEDLRKDIAVQVSNERHSREYLERGLTPRILELEESVKLLNELEGMS